MSCTELLELREEQIIAVLNKEYELLKEQAALFRIMNDIIDQLETCIGHQVEMELELDMLKMKNISLRMSISNMSM